VSTLVLAHRLLTKAKIVREILMAMTWRDAAIEALKINGVSSAADIVRVIAENELREVTGSTPEATVGAVLYTAVQDGDPRVRTTGPGFLNIPAAWRHHEQLLL
jgi:hypothetical protein